MRFFCRLQAAQRRRSRTRRLRVSWIPCRRSFTVWPDPLFPRWGVLRKQNVWCRRALELQPDYLFGLWAHALALCGLGRNEEAIVSFERVLLQSRAPVFVGMVGFGYGWAGRSEDAIRLLHELEDRGSRGEYIPAVALMTIYLGLRDLPGIRGELSKAIAEMVAPLTVRVINGRFLENFRSDPEVDRLHRELFGW